MRLLNEANALYDCLSRELQRPIELAREKGASSWLTAQPLTAHGFSLHKTAFRDAVCLRYNWQPSFLPTHCVCGENLGT